jgi:hypothetical protein
MPQDLLTLPSGKHLLLKQIDPSQLGCEDTDNSVDFRSYHHSSIIKKMCYFSIERYVIYILNLREDIFFL